MDAGRITPLDAATSSPVDRRISELATRQHGVVARHQLLELGVGRHGIQRRLNCGLLHALHAGVYAVGHRSLTQLARWKAAELACGASAVISHRSAAELWAITKPRSGPVHVISSRSRGSRPGIVVHRPHQLSPSERSIRDGIAVTSPARTLLDLAASLGPAALRDAVDEAYRRHDLSPVAVGRLCERHRSYKNRARLIALVTRYRPLPETRSPPERRFIRLCDDAGIPRPAVNVPLCGYEVDCLWPTQRLVVEVDSWTYHGDPESFEADLRRDAILQLHGYRVRRFTRRRIESEPAAVVGELKAALRPRA